MMNHKFLVLKDGFGAELRLGANQRRGKAQI
jgi:hypothetical protein